jgi:hypothetical protein
VGQTSSRARRKTVRHIIPISGKDSCCTALVQMAREPREYELFFSDVGKELPETYEWLLKVEKTLKLKINRVGESLEKIILKYNILPAPKVRFCTKEAKIWPMEEWIGEDQATVYFGIRADEDRAGYSSAKHNIIPRYPLKELGINLKQVYMVLENKSLLPPTFFWKRVYDKVLDALRAKKSLGLSKDPEERLKELPREVFDYLFCWRTRSNCYFCFFQALWEWAGLYEHHPELFFKAEELENKVGSGDEREKPYTWIKDYPLSKVKENFELIVQRRVNKVLRTLKTKKLIHNPDDLLSVTSCGLFCGK